MLTIAGMTHTFGGLTAIADLTFQVPQGTIYSVIGPNGAGKTTLFNLLTGVYRPTAGSIQLMGDELAGMTPLQIAKKGVSRTFQNLQIFAGMTALENVMVGCHDHGKCGLLTTCLGLPTLQKEERCLKEMAQEALEFCGLSSIAERPVSALPYGILKKLEIARALATRPKLLLMDEPAAGLNDTETGEMVSMIRSIQQANITVLLVEHNMRLIMDVSHHILVLNYGQKLAEGTPHDIQHNKAVIDAYLGNA
ncbi:MAG: ABC transporter ATP-binding protein [Dissulfuribacterales bacterium]